MKMDGYTILVDGNKFEVMFETSVGLWLSRADSNENVRKAYLWSIQDLVDSGAYLEVRGHDY